MTQLDSTPGTATRTPVEIVSDFFDAYRRHDVTAMADLCTDNADFSYIPFEVWGKQRVLRGDGKVGTVGKVLWTGLIHSFPDLFNAVHHIDANDEGDVVVSCDIGGTQQSAWATITPQGRNFSEPHLFVMHVNEEGLIDSIRAYWDNAGICRQLGHLEVD
jgi:ketosteroid isomerase-like protein